MSLANLPTELLQRIASFCPGDDIVRLSSTCRYLRASCYDLVVLQESFALYAPAPKSPLVSSSKDVANWIMADLRRRESMSANLTWARLSAAASRYGSWKDRLNDLLESYESVALTEHPFPGPEVLTETKDIVGALAALTVLGSPQVNDWTATAALTGLAAVVMEAQFWTNEDPPLDLPFCAQLLFCVATGLLNHGVLNNMVVLAVRVDDHIVFRAGARDIMHQDKIMSWLGHQAFALLRQSVMIWMIKSSVEAQIRNDLPRPARLTFGCRRDVATDKGEGSGPAPPPLPLPSPGERPASGSPLAPFAAATEWSDWMRGCVQAISRDMEDGEWYGYFTRGTSRSDLGSPMSNIRFVFDQDLSVMDIMKFRADNCVDEHGTFALEGRVWADASRECGRIFFRQERQGTSSFQYFGVMTPLGISGYWSWSGRNTKGMFWLWKREWAEPEGGS